MRSETKRIKTLRDQLARLDGWIERFQDQRQGVALELAQLETARLERKRAQARERQHRYRRRKADLASRNGAGLGIAGGGAAKESAADSASRNGATMAGAAGVPLKESAADSV